jgi:hypothetical protein
MTDELGTAPEAVLLNEVDDAANNQSTNFWRVGSVRPSALLYTGGIGSTIDLPHFSVMVEGLESWERHYKKLSHVELVTEARLLDAVRAKMGPTVLEMRKAPWVQDDGISGDAHRVGAPAALFPKWLRCTGCNLLAPVDSQHFSYINKNKFRPDQARFEHKSCKGKNQNASKVSNRPAVPARFLLACVDGHLDEFPFVEWVHKADSQGWKCIEGVVSPQLELEESPSITGPMVIVKCRSCNKTRSIQEAAGEKGEEKLPKCRGRNVHLGKFEEKCDNGTKLMLLGAANQWFPSIIGILVMPTMLKKTKKDLASLIETHAGAVLAAVNDLSGVAILRELLLAKGVDLDGVNNEDLWHATQEAKNPDEASVSESGESDPNSLLIPEWDVMSNSDMFKSISEKSEFRLKLQSTPDALSPIVQEVVAVERLKKVSAFVGFTRVDPEDRIGEETERLVPISRNPPSWVPATEDKGEGVFLRFDESKVFDWEQQILQTNRWKKLRESHARNYTRRLSKSAVVVDPDTKMPPPRYWALHSLAHILIREMAAHSGYGAASLTERIYAWPGTESVSAAAGILISTTSSDSEGTLGGLVELSRPELIKRIIVQGLRKSEHCSSDPLCAHKLPISPEDYLHGSACHFCLFISETSCERANRYLDRAMVRTLTDSGVSGLLEDIEVVRR